MTEPDRTDEGAVAISSMRFILQEGEHRGEAYTAELAVCSNPVCRCGVMWFDVRADEDPRRNYRFPLDIIERCIPGKEARELAVHDRNFARAFVRELDDEQWRVLDGRFHSLKIRLIESCDLDKLEVSFPEEDIETEGFMVGYHEIIPFARPIVLEDGALQYLAFDQYCLRPSCGCTTSALTIVAMGNSAPAKPQEMAAVMYDYRSGTWETRAEAARSRSAAHAPLATLFVSNPALASTLRERHRTLKRLYARYRRRHAPSAPGGGGTESRVGRNEPCPCGSGRKYKHCCGR